jgi:hypothetical protein
VPQHRHLRPPGQQGEKGDDPGGVGLPPGVVDAAKTSAATTATWTIAIRGGQSIKLK